MLSKLPKIDIDPELIETEIEKLRKINFNKEELQHFTALVLVRMGILMQYKGALDAENAFIRKVLAKREDA